MQEMPGDTKRKQEVPDGILCGIYVIEHRLK